MKDRFNPALKGALAALIAAGLAAPVPATAQEVATAAATTAPKAKKKKPKAAPAVSNCVEGKVLSAMQLRIIQTELMVAGLSCKTTAQWGDRANTKRYNDFVIGYRPNLMEDAHKVLARYFKNETRLNDYLTRLANDASQRSLANIAVFCDQAARIYDEVLQPQKVELASFSAGQPFSGTHGFPVCNQQTVATPSTAPVIPASTGPSTAAPVTAPATPAQPMVAPKGSDATPVVAKATVVASNETTPVTASGAMVMAPVVEETRSRAVTKPVTPKMKPAL